MHDSKNARPKKIAIIGAGNIGKELWKELTEKGAADEIVVHNRSNNWDNESFKGTMIAVDQANIIRNEEGRTSQFTFTTDIKEALKGADIVVVTAGVARKNKSQPRTELLAANCEVIDPLAEAARLHAPDANYIIATNPVDAMTQRFQQKSGLPENKILGLSGELDRVRMVQSICNQLKISPDCISNAHVIGQHGPAMLPLLSQVIIQRKGEKPHSLMSELEGNPEAYKEIINAAVEGGARLVERLGTSDHIAPAAALEKMVNAVISAKWKKQETLLHASTLNQSDDIFIGQPLQLHKDGSHSVLALPNMNKSEVEAWDKSVKSSKAVLADMPGYNSSLSLAG